MRHDINDETLKLQTIREIIQDGREVKHYIIRHNLTDEQAYIVESTLIDLLTFHDFNLESVLTISRPGIINGMRASNQQRR